MPAAESSAPRSNSCPCSAFQQQLLKTNDYWQHAFGGGYGGAAQLVVNDLRALSLMCERGVGITVLPCHMCEAQLARGTLVAVHEPETAPTNTLFIAWRVGALVDGSPARRLRDAVAAAGAWLRITTHATPVNRRNNSSPLPR